MNIFLLMLIFAYLVAYYRDTYISWDEPIYIDIYICISSVNITKRHTYLGMNLFILILISAYVVWILLRDIHILGWTYFYWYYVCISSVILPMDTYLGSEHNIDIFAYLVWILPRDIHILGWTYVYWYIYLHI